jgi:shikimate kinase/3-dehydroquinate synthase
MSKALVITGYPASGKRTVAELLAKGRGWTVRSIAHTADRAATASDDGAAPLGQLGLQQAARARDLGSRVLGELERGVAQIVVAPLEAFACRELRLEILERAVVVALEVSPRTALERASRAGLEWVARASAQGVEDWFQSLAPAAAETHGRVSTDGRAPEAVSAEVAAVWERTPVVVAAGLQTYGVEVGRGILEPRCDALVAGASRVLLVTDDNVDPLHAARVETRIRARGAGVIKVVLPAGERSKIPRSLVRIWREALDGEADRSAVALGIGGGVVTDITGFAAATWMRGIRWFGAPTTLLAMVDASVGGKTGVDLQDAKNAVGAFWQPSGVVIDVDVLRTEPARGYTSALAEVVKTAIIGDPVLFDRLESDSAAVVARDAGVVEDMVRRSVAVKASIVSRDERESGLRAVLNLGHTIGHALESGAGYEGLTHGEAVSLGLVAALRVGRDLGRTPPELVSRVVALLGKLGLPIELATQDCRSAAALIGHDKKRKGNHIRFVVAEAVGRVACMDVPLDDLRARAAALG